MSVNCVGDVETEKFSLEVVECSCGFHLGIDATYLDLVDGVDIKCPSCGEMISVCADEPTVYESNQTRWVR
jgi:hypothetical protein